MSAPTADGPAHAASPPPDPSAGVAAPVGNLNIANVLTGARLVAVPFFTWALVVGAVSTAHRWAAAAIFVAAAITDRLDGELARRRGLVTDLGKIADPIADKALTGAALVTLSWLGELPWWVTALVLVREWGVTLVRLAVLRHGVIAAGRGGKVKTVLQIVAIIALLPPAEVWLVGPWLHRAGLAVMAVAVLVTVVTGVQYLVAAVRLVRRGRHA